MKILSILLMLLPMLSWGDAYILTAPYVIPDRRDEGPDVFALRPKMTQEMWQDSVLWLTANLPVIDEGETTARWLDASPQKNDAVQEVVLSQPARVKDADGNWVYRFDGADDFVNAGPLPVTNITACLWYRYTTPATTHALIRTDQDGAARSWLVDRSASILRAGVFIGETSTLQSAAAPTATNVWNHVGISFDSSRVSLWLNGVEVSGQSLSGSMTPSSDDVLIGTARSSGSLNAFNGDMADIVMWSVGDTNLIINTYNQQKARYGHE